MQPVRRLQSSVDIMREYRACQTVSGVVRLPDNVRVVVELDNYTYRPEDFLTDDLHIWRGIGEDGWFDEVSFVAVTFASDVACSTLFYARLDVSHNALWQIHNKNKL